MSFNVGVKAKSKEVALKMLDSSVAFGNIPKSVKDFIRTAIISMDALKPNYILAINASGHLCTGADSFDNSNCTVEVRKEYLHVGEE